jgi:Protein of unknown function (DUF3071)
MQELRFVAVSEDGRYAVLAVPGRSARFTLPIDERLRAVALGQTSRLAQYEIEVESPLRPKEIQARIRAGETVEEIADAAGIAVERVRWFEGPVLAERAYVAEQAQTASVRRPGESTPGPRLGEITAERLSVAGADPDDVQWDARKRGDGNWQVQLTFTTGGRLHVAEWLYDPRRRHVIPSDDTAARMSLPGSELPEPVAPGHGEATVTRLAPRLRHDPPAPVVPVAPVTPPPPPVAAAAAGLAHAASAETSHRTASADQGWHESPAAARPPVPAETDPPRQQAEAPRIAPSVPDAAASAEVDQPAPVRETPAPREAAVEEQVVVTPAPAQPVPAQPAPAQPAASPAPADVPAETAAKSSNADSNGEQPARANRKNARGRRSSVPSWDEIMLGSSRQRD